MTAKQLIAELAMSEQFFNRSTEVLTEENSTFRPSEGAWTAAQQVAHVAQSIDWFIDACNSPKGFDMDFAKHNEEVMAVESLQQAREWLRQSFKKARDFFESKSEAELSRPFPAGPVLGGEPISACISGICDNTAHHRGALTVYSRLLGKTPAMPYM